MRKCSCRLERNSCSAIVEGEIRRMVEPQRICQLQAAPGRNHPLTHHMRFSESGCNVDRATVGTLAAHRRDGSDFLACGSADRDSVAYSKTFPPAHTNPGCSGICRS